MMRASTLWFVRKIRDEESKSADPGMDSCSQSGSIPHPGNQGPGLTVSKALCDLARRFSDFTYDLHTHPLGPSWRNRHFCHWAFAPAVPSAWNALLSHLSLLHLLRLLFS